MRSSLLVPASVLCATLLASQLSAINTTASCSVATAGTVASNFTCSLGGVPPSSAMATVTATESITGNSLVTSASTSVGAVAPTTFGWSQATSSANFDINLYTSGPVRSGYVEVITNTSFWNSPFGGTSSLQYSLGSVSGNCVLNCNSSTFWMPFTLGSSFQLSETQSFFAFADANAVGTSAGQGATTLTFNFFEADGTTAVAVFDPPSEVPEPASTALFSVGFLALSAISYSRYVRRQQTQSAS